jgi:catechol 2,3-dioxygenase
MSLIDHLREPHRVTAPLTGLRLGAVELTVRDLGRSIAWYQRALGLQLHSQGETFAALGDGHETLVILAEDPEARPAGRGTAGLYHYALLYPTREDLARAAVRLAATRTQIDGASDHGFHEAIYLPDPDGNGIELAADRARELWPAHGDAAAARPRPLDFASLMATVAGEPPITAVPAACAWATCTSTWAASRTPSRSIATSSASSRTPTTGWRHSSPSTATTTTSR